MIRFAHEKNNDNFRTREAEAFDDIVNDLSLIELPLIDRLYTWSNRRANPTLERIDRAFINLAWDAVPNSILSSLTRTTSDHVPLKIQISSSVPKSSIYRYEPSWALQPGFQEMISTAWNLQHSPHDPAASLVIRLKTTRAASKNWRRHQGSISQREVDCKLLISLLDAVEEIRPLNHPELVLLEIIVRLLSRTVKEKLLLWKQRSKIRAAIEGDENTRYFHACASQQLRHNKIQVLDHDDMELFGHDQKAQLLFGFYNYNSLLGASCHTSWRFKLNPMAFISHILPLEGGNYRIWREKYELALTLSENDLALTSSCSTEPEDPMRAENVTDADFNARKRDHAEVRMKYDLDRKK
ncbi:uncharacterized protein [Miscanthus floridulus]|uniref:uncharacterized protein n=1 Tax=Miscanthus floridulus TaxID=154761 RepID=UPI0034595747